MTNSLLLKIAVEIVDLPIDSMDIFHSYVTLAEGRSHNHKKHHSVTILRGSTLGQAKGNTTRRGHILVTIFGGDTW